MVQDLQEVQLHDCDDQLSLSSADATTYGEALDKIPEERKDSLPKVFDKAQHQIAEKLEIQYELFKQNILGITRKGKKNNSNDSNNEQDNVIEDCEKTVMEIENFCTNLHRLLVKRKRSMNELCDIDNHLYLILNEQALKEDYEQGFQELGLSLQHKSQQTRDLIMPPYNHAINLLDTIIRNAIPDFKQSLKKYRMFCVESEVYGHKAHDLSVKISNIKNPAPIEDAENENKPWQWINKVAHPQKQKSPEELLKALTDDMEAMKAHEEIASKKMEMTRQEILDKTSLLSIKIKQDLSKKLADIAEASILINKE